MPPTPTHTSSPFAAPDMCVSSRVMTHIWVVDAGRNPHILTLSPPLNIDAKWFKDHTAYTISKFGMSMCVLGMSAEFKVRVVLPPSGSFSSWHQQLTPSPQRRIGELLSTPSGPRPASVHTRSPPARPFLATLV